VRHGKREHGEQDPYEKDLDPGRASEQSGVHPPQGRAAPWLDSTALGG
jgi:hypothetical protein